MIERRETRRLSIGDVPVGGGAPISVQSMTNVSTADTGAVVRQIRMLEDAGCEIVRVAVPNMEAVKSLSEIKGNIGIPLVTDIHFDHELALAAMDAGVDKVRINPGNMRDPEKVRQVVRKAKSLGIPMRVGANSGSILPRGKAADGPRRHATADYMVDAVLDYLRLFDEEEFRDVVISLKSSNVIETMRAYQLFSEKSDCPLHLGVTAAGTDFSGSIKSAVGIGGLLARGIGDTIRVSLTGDPVEEVRVAREILQSLGVRKFHPEVISCPTCARCRIDLVSLVHELERERAGSEKGIRIALMGCEVNGPGEAADADVGIASGGVSGVMFRKGKMVRKLDREEFVKALVDEVDKWREA